MVPGILGGLRYSAGLLFSDIATTHSTVKHEGKSAEKELEAIRGKSSIEHNFS